MKNLIFYIVKKYELFEHFKNENIFILSKNQRQNFYVSIINVCKYRQFFLPSVNRRIFQDKGSPHNRINIRKVVYKAEVQLVRAPNIRDVLIIPSKILELVIPFYRLFLFEVHEGSTIRSSTDIGHHVVMYEQLKYLNLVDAIRSQHRSFFNWQLAGAFTKHKGSILRPLFNFRCRRPCVTRIKIMYNTIIRFGFKRLLKDRY